MNNIFDYEFGDVPAVEYLRYEDVIDRDEVVRILNLLTDALRQIEYMNGEAMRDSVVAYKTYRAACAALNDAQILGDEEAER